MASFVNVPHKFSNTTHDIRISVVPLFLDDESDPDKNHYVWAYHIHIENVRDDDIQLLSRYWKITDGTGMVKEIRGDGVIGEQPLLHPHAQYEYASAVPLTTPTGFMGGLYYFRTASGDDLEVVIPTFSLDSPYEILSIH